MVCGCPAFCPAQTVEETLGAARQRLPELLTRAQPGISSLISRHGRTVAALVPVGGRISSGAAVLVSDNPLLAQTEQQPVLSALRR